MSERAPKSEKIEPGSPTDPAPFGQYFLLGLIARGGMAEVYRARRRDPEDPRLWAIKVMRPELARETRFVDMFHREGQLALLLRHPAIVETIDVGETEGRHYIAMEYIAGRDLTQVLRRCQKNNTRLAVPYACYIAAQMAAGLDFAHNLADNDGRLLNIVNRDVSPSNVRIAFDGQVKLIDFGIAQALMKFTSEIGVLKGKFSYMSPEQIRGMPVDARTDVFSVGIVLHEMLATEKLFRGDTEFALMEKVRKAEVEPPSKFNRRVSPALDAIVLKTLARDVNDRFQTAGMLAKMLNELLLDYKFDMRELRDFVRKEFRAEYAKEDEQDRMAMTSLPLGTSPAVPTSQRFHRSTLEPDATVPSGPRNASAGAENRQSPTPANLSGLGETPAASGTHTAKTQPTPLARPATGLPADPALAPQAQPAPAEEKSGFLAGLFRKKR